MSVLLMKVKTAVSAVAAVAAAVASAEEPARWSRPWDMEAETEFSRDRQESPWNHFLLDGQQGFVSGREFYQASGEISPFLWPNHPFLRFGTDRSWQSDTNTLEVRVLTGNEVGDALLQELPESNARTEDNRTPLTSGDVSWAPIEELRLHAGLDQNDHSSYRTYPFRIGLAGQGKREQLSWFGGNLPPKSQANLGGTFERLGSLMALQANQGWWWTQSPASGFPYPWEGFNADFLYRPGKDFELSLIEQRWDSPLDQLFYRAHWRRSELDMGITGTARGGWFWRLDLGFQRREMVSDSLFKPFLEQTYPTRFRYRQIWSAPDSIPLQLVSSGSMGFRERVIHAQHTTEFRETWGTHQPRQILKGYWRHPMAGYRAPTEFFPTDSTWTAESHPGRQARGVSGEAEFREKRKAFEFGLAGTYAMEWEAPVFHLRRSGQLGHRQWLRVPPGRLSGQRPCAPQCRGTGLRRRQSSRPGVLESPGRLARILGRECRFHGVPTQQVLGGRRRRVQVPVRPEGGGQCPLPGRQGSAGMGAGLYRAGPFREQPDPGTNPV